MGRNNLLATMSDIAVNARDEILRAEEVESRYRRHPSLESPYRCLYCNIDVVPCAYDGAGYKHGAYFRADPDKHRPGCPYAGADGWTGSSRSATREIFSQEVFLPTKLIPRRPASLGTVEVTPGTPGSPAWISERVRRYKKVAEGESPVVTSVLPTLVDAWRRARAICFAYGQANNKKPLWPFVSNKLRQYPLELFGDDLDYDRAFHAFQSTWRGNAVHHGTAAVKEAADGFSLVSVDVRKDEEEPVDGVVHVRSNFFDAADKVGKTLVGELQKAEAEGLLVDWYGYGKLEADVIRAQGATAPRRPHLELQIFEPSLLYVRNFRPTPVMAPARAA